MSAVDDYLAFFDASMMALAPHVARSLEDGHEFELVIAFREKVPNLMDRWLHLRTFDGANELEDFYREAARQVSNWDHDPTHTRYTPIEVGEPDAEDH